MAENQPSAVTAKDRLTENSRKVFSKRKEVLGLLKEADSKGDIARARELQADAIALTNTLKRLESDYETLDAQEREQKLAEVTAAQEALRSGGYRQEMSEVKVTPMMVSGDRPPSYQDVSVYVPRTKPQEQIDKERAELVSKVSNIDPTKITFDSPLSESQKYDYASLTNRDKRRQFLEREFGKGSVFPVQEGGDINFYIKMPDGKLASVDKTGLSGAAGVAITEGPAIIGEIAVGGATLAGSKSPTLAAAAGATTYGLISGGIDALTEKRLGLGDTDFGEIATRRGLESALSLGTGVGATAVGKRVAASKVGDMNFVTDFSKKLDNATKRFGLEPTVLTTAGEQGIKKQQDIAAMFPDSPLAASMKRVQDQLAVLAGKKVAGSTDAQIYKDIAKQSEAIEQGLISSVAQSKNAPEQLVRQLVENKVKINAADADQLGKSILAFTKGAEDEALALRNNAYKQLFDDLDSAGFSVKPEDLLDFVRKSRLDNSKDLAVKNPALEQIEKTLQDRIDAPKRLAELDEMAQNMGGLAASQLALREELELLSKPITASNFDVWIRKMKEPSPDDPTGKTTSSILASDVARDVTNLRKQMYAKYNKTLPDGTTVNLGDEFEKVTQLHNERMEFTRRMLGDLASQEGGVASMYPRQAVNNVIGKNADPAKIRELISTVKQYEGTGSVPSGSSQQLQEMMQRQYFQNLGFNTPKGPGRVVNYDRAIMQELYGDKADRVIKTVDEFNKLHGNVAKDLTFEDVKAMSGVIDEQSKKKLYKQVAKRIQYEKELERARNSEVMKLARKGNFDKLDQESLVRTLFSDSFTSGETKTLMNDLSRYAAQKGGTTAQARNMLKQDFLKGLLDRFPNGNPTTVGSIPMFDTESFVKAMDAPSGQSMLRKKAEIVLGEDTTQELYDLALAYNANQIKRDTTEELAIRAVGGLSKVVAYVSGNLTESGRNRLLAMQLSNPKDSRRLRLALNKASNSGEIEKVFREMFTDIYTTSQGLQKAAYHASQDEEMSNFNRKVAEDFRNAQEAESR